LKEDVLEAFKRFNMALTPPPAREIRQNISDIVSGSEVDRLSSQEIMVIYDKRKITKQNILTSSMGD
jgi:hypothetical protein